MTPRKKNNSYNERIIILIFNFMEELTMKKLNKIWKETSLETINEFMDLVICFLCSIVALTVMCLILTRANAHGWDYELKLFAAGYGYINGYALTYLVNHLDDLFPKKLDNGNEIND